METTQLKSLMLSDSMMTAQQMSAYAESTFVHISGDQGIGDIGLSGCLVVGTALSVADNPLCMALNMALSDVYVQQSSLESIIDSKISTAIGKAIEEEY